MTETDDAATTEPVHRRVPWRRIGRVIGMLVLLAVVIPFVVYAVPQVVGADQSYVVLSGSMEPAMSPGDVVIVDSVGAAAIQEGDVITFSRNGEDTPTTHRVIEVVDQNDGVAFRTQGDANEDPDAQLVTPSQVEGEVLSVGGYLFVIPYIGYVIQFMQTTTGFVALFVVPVVLLIVSELWNVVASSGGDGSESSESADSAGVESADDADVPTDETAVTGTKAGTATGDAGSQTTATEPGTSEGQLTFSALELQLGLAALGAFLAYSIWVVYATVTIFESGVIWAAGVAAAVAVAFLLFLGLYISGRRGGSDDPDGTGQPSEATATAADGGEDAGESIEPNGSDAGADQFDWDPSASETGADDTRPRVDGDASGGEDDD